MRADHLGCYGNRTARTPVIDALAAEGTLFLDVTAPAPITAPSHASLLTGLYPPQHGVRSNGLYRLPPAVTTLAEELGAAGFTTGAAIGGFPLSSRFGFSQGFATFDERLGGGEEAERPAAGVADAAIAFLSARKPAERFFLFAHFYDAHADYRPHPGIEAASPYDGEITFVDQAVGRVMASLRERGLMDTTAVIVASDHGEGLGEHGEATHAVFVYQSTLHVPLIVRAPMAPAGRRVSEPVSLVDVAPTAREVLGLPARDGPGQSLVPSFAGRSKAGDRALYFESMLPEVEFRWAPLKGVRRGAFKLIKAPRSELYTLDADPSEATNRFGETAGAALAAELAILEKRLQPVATSTQTAPDAEERARLESLGYIGGEGGPPREDAPDPKDRMGVLEKMVEGLTEFKAARFDAAEAAYREALGRDPGNAVLRKNLARAVAASKRPDEARELYSQAEAAAASPGLKADILDLRAELALSEGDAASARDDARKAAALDPALGRATITLAAAERALGHPSDADDILARAAEARPDDAGILVALAEARIAAGRTGDAESSLRKAIAIEPGHGRAHYDLGILLRARDPQAAIAELEAARVALPGGEVVRVLAEAYDRGGRAPDAVSLLRERVTQAPDDAESRYALAVVLSRDGATAEAVEILEALARNDPGSAPIWNALGTAQARSGALEPAIDAFRKAVAIAPGSRSYRENLANAYLASGAEDLGNAELSRAKALPAAE